MIFKTKPKDKSDLYEKLMDGGCTICKRREFFAGPRGGMSQNMLCTNPDCRMEFNVAIGFGFAEQTGIADQERFAFFHRFAKVTL